MTNATKSTTVMIYLILCKMWSTECS